MRLPENGQVPRHGCTLLLLCELLQFKFRELPARRGALGTSALPSALRLEEELLILRREAQAQHAVQALAAEGHTPHAVTQRFFGR